MKSINQTPNLTGHNQRNAFDLSQNQLFTVSCGELLPCYCCEVNPNEHFRINIDSFVRTAPLNAPAYIRLKQNVEFYFVPMRLLDSSFNQTLFQTNYNYNNLSTDGKGLGESLPHTLLLKGQDIHSWFSLLSTDSNDLNAFGVSVEKLSSKIADMLGYGCFSSQKEDVWTTSTLSLLPNVNVYRALAYQKIYMDFYRNPLYEGNDPKLYNIDWYALDTTINPLTSIWTNIYNPFLMRYRNWKRDYISNIRPSFARTDFMINRTVLQQNVGMGTSDPTEHGTFRVVESNLYPMQATLYRDNLTSVNSGTITVSNIRSAFALDKMLRLTSLAKDGDYSSQVMAHYGISTDLDSKRCMFLGGFDSPIQISEVVSTANTVSGSNGSYVGDLFGKGLGLSSNNHEIDFTSTEHGIIMGIYSVVPNTDYDSYALDQFNVKSLPTDYFQPEYEDLNYQPVYAYEFSSIYDGEPINTVTQLIGYNYRYSEYKSKLDKVHGAFRRNNSLSAWAAPRQAAAKKFFNNGLTWEFFKIYPQILDSVMLAKYDGSDETDQFYVDLHISNRAIRPMSVYGIPNL